MKNQKSDLTKPFSLFLQKNGFLPLSIKNPHWNRLDVFHFKEKPPNKEVVKFRRLIREQIKGGGIYIYLTKRGKLLYLGKGKTISDRIISHYREAYERLGADHPGVWHKFFNDHAGNLTILWRNIERDRQMIAIEEMIEDVVRSEFDRVYPRGKRKLGYT